MEQIKHTLPKSAWEQISIHENNEPLITISESEKIVYAPICKISLESRKVRLGIHNKIVKVAKNLPDGYKLVIIEGFRSIASQQISWDRMWKKIKISNPSLPDE